MMLERVFVAMIFAAVFVAVMALALLGARTRHLRRRLVPAFQRAPAVPGLPDRSGARALVARNFDHRYFALDPAAKGELRKTLIRAGFFSADAAAVYVAARFALCVFLPAAGFAYGAYALPGGSWLEQTLLCGLLFCLALYAPTAYLARRTGALEEEYRETFPDMMDWLLVCAEGGLSLEAAIDRVAPELAVMSPALGVNLTLVTAEVRAGRSAIEALQTFADRVGIEEAASLATLLRQSMELGASVGHALRIYSEEMRDRRMSRAEERAHQLPVKLMLPLALFIFPNIMLIVFLPIVSRFMTTGVIPTIAN
ncbi:MAG: hypothetical protein JWN93_491 [Hyphomicrobiales bacterium]|nr:hypothetical protein [Hyphomicrobiales bacterium]